NEPGKRQEHFAFIEYVDVFIEHERMLEPDVRSQRRHRRGLALSLDGLTYLNIDVRHAAPRHRQMQGFDPGHGSLHRAENFALLCQTDDPTDIADHHVVPIGIIDVRIRGYFEP